MSVTILRPLTAARRRASVVRFQELSKDGPVKRLTRPRKERAGRSTTGEITVRHRGGSRKRRYRVVDLGEEKENVPGTVEAIEYDPNRTAFLARIRYIDGDRRYRLAWDGVHVGQRTLVAANANPVPGNRLPLDHVPVGSQIFGIEFTPRRGGMLVRSAGSAATLQEITGGFAQLRLPSGEIRLVPQASWATVGVVSNVDHRTERIGWAGRRRRMGWRPSVRGKAMNAVDHPHGQGGGGGHTSIGLKYPKTFTGRHALGVRTRQKHKYSHRFIVHRRTP